MLLEMRKEDIFNYIGEEGAHFVQCISADFACGAGIAVDFNKYFDIKNQLLFHYKRIWKGKGYCIKIPLIPVFNLVTKQYYYQKPTMNTMIQALLDFHSFYTKERMTSDACTIYMPKIGCGLDKLKWMDIEEAIKEIFKDTDINIVVCYL